jgi:DnaK suppressor protein
VGSFEKRVKRRIERELAEVNELIGRFRLSEGDEVRLEERVEAELHLDRSAKLGELLERASALEEALYRLQRGTFGRCIVCDRSIGQEAIDASPEVALCRDCQSLLEKARPPKAAANQKPRAARKANRSTPGRQRPWTGAPR